MRQHLRFLLFCCVAALTAGCSDTNEPNPNNSLSPSLAPCGSIGDRVWLDANCNGIQDGGEVGVAGVTVELYSLCSGDALVGTDVTDGSGNYLFENLEDTIDYRVHFVLPAGYEFAPQNMGGVEADDSDADLVTGFSQCVDVGSCKAPRFVDAGLCLTDTPPCAAIGDRVWLDVETCNGIQDGGEAGVPGVTVQLYTCEGALVDTDVTDANGNYLFDDLDDTIDYRVCFVLPPGFSFAPANQGGEADDSDAGADGCTSCIDVSDCKIVLTVDAGLCREDEEEGEGCTPGFWKNHFEAWGPTGFSPDDVFDDVFGCDLFGDDTTLGEALESNGTLKSLGFHAVAALLNAAHPDVDYAYSVNEVMDIVCDAVASGDLEEGKDLLADANEEDCPLGNGNGGDD